MAAIDRLPACLERHSLKRGCAGTHDNNHIPNCRRSSLAILRPGGFQLQPLPVPPPEAAWACYPREVLLQHAKSGLQLPTSLPAPMRTWYRVYDVTDEFAIGTASSMSEPSEPVLQEHGREDVEVKAMT